MVITGESGAGKSFTTNRMLDYLSAIGRGDGDPRPPAFREPPIQVRDIPFKERSITDKLLSSTAIVEAFGNAKMPRNNDSSRFGKLYRVFFDTSSRQITGCSIDPYLLEKSRVTNLAKGERGFHIFYELVRGLNPDEASKFRVQTVDSYQWLKPPAGIKPTYDVDGVDDAEQLVGVKDALINFCPGNEDNVIKSTLAVLRMGDIIIECDKHAAQASIPGYDEAVGDVAFLFGVEEETLRKAITCQTLTVMKAATLFPISEVAAKKFNAAIAKSVYNEQFKWLVAQCSKDLVKEVPTNDLDGGYLCPFIAVLDIFGFEFIKDSQLVAKGSADKNSFEQWCINACNEKLQNLFVDIVIDMEKFLYKEELGEVPKSLDEFPRNDDTLELIFGRNKSVYSNLENVSLSAARSSDADANFDGKFLGDIKQQIGKHARLDFKPKILKTYAKARRDSPGGFITKHYAANVLYDPDGWVDKNQDKITQDMKECLAGSKMAIPGEGPGSGWLPKVYQGMLDGEGKSASGSVLAQFRRQLNSLCETLKKCDTGFVRCIKPNRAKVRDVYEADLILTQLAYTGMLSSLRIQKAGYPVRKKHQEYLDEMRCLDPDAAKEGVQALVDSINKNRMPDIIKELQVKPPENQLDDDAIKVGKVELVLSRDWAHTQVEIQCRVVKGASAVTIQAAYRASDETKSYKAKHEASLEMIPLIRGLLNRLKYYPMKYSKMEVMSRTSMTRMLRATKAREQYYTHRKEHFYDENCHSVQTLIQATLYRQWYYERKLEFMEHET